MLFKAWFEFIVPWARIFYNWSSPKSSSPPYNDISTCVFFCSNHTCSSNNRFYLAFFNAKISIFFCPVSELLVQRSCFFSWCCLSFSFLSARLKNNREKLLFSHSVWNWKSPPIFINSFISQNNLPDLLFALISDEIMMKLNNVVFI